MLNQSDALDRIYHALADASRRRVVLQLSKAPATVSELARPLKMSMPSVLQHLRVLEDSGLIRSEKSGRVRTCHIEPKALGRAGQWIAAQRQQLEQQLDRLDAFLAKNDPQPRQGKKS